MDQMLLINWLLLIVAAGVLIAIIAIAYRRHCMIKAFEVEQARLQAYFEDQMRRGSRATEHRIKL